MEQVSQDRQTADNLHRDLSIERGEGRKNNKSRNLSNRSLKTDRETDSGEPL